MDNSFAEKYPDLFKEWNFELNKDLDPTKSFSSHNVKVFWTCNKDLEHIWQTSISHRIAGTKCPYCSNQKILLSNSLATTNPSLANDWHPTLNGNLTAKQVAAGSDKKVWWLCSTNKEHYYQAKISSRNRGAICSVCAGRVVVFSNSIENLFPDIANEWHKTLNKKSPDEFTAGSNTYIHWQCSQNPTHIWKAKICNRTMNKRGCPYCKRRKADEKTNINFLFPNLMKEWDYEKNTNIQPEKLLSNSSKIVWWKCYKNTKHNWQARIYSRTRNNYKCPYCSGRFADENNNITITHYHFLKEWDYERNKISPTEYKFGSNKKVWWKCKNGADHNWLTSINNRANGKNCPICAGQKVVKSTQLTTTDPIIAKQWNYSKNGNLKPEQFHGGSSKSVWWKCDKGEDHEWKTEIRVRTLGSGCPVCINKKVVLSNCLQTTHPKLASEFQKDRNENLSPLNVSAGSNKKVWWQCKHNPTHEWKTVITSRAIYKTGCPYCDLTPQSKEELIILFELKEIFKDISTKPFKIKFGKKVYSFDIFIPSLNLVIEYDGKYWHKNNQEVDEKKIRIALSDSLNIFRIRQSPLEKITEDDILVPSTFNGKIYTDLILQNIFKLYSDKITLQQLKKIEIYLTIKQRKADKKLEKYIDDLLAQKTDNIGRKQNGRQHGFVASGADVSY